jgi:hypothetical protein
MAEKKKAKVEVRRSSTTSASAKEAAYGKREVIYEKPKKPKKDLNSADYQGLTKAQRNTKYYNSTADAVNGEMIKTLKNLNKAKTNNLTNKEAKNATENPKAKGKDFTKATISNVNEAAYQRVMKRAANSGLSAADAKKAIDAAIRTTSAGLKSDRDKVAMRFKMQDSKKKLDAQNKIKRGY